MRIDDAELYLLVLRTGDHALVLMTAGGEIFPHQDFPVNKEVVVQNTGRNRQQEGVLFFFVLRIVGGALDQKVIVRHEHRPGLCQDWLLSTRISADRRWGELQFRRLGGWIHARLGPEFGSGEAARGALLDREFFGGDLRPFIKTPKEPESTIWLAVSVSLSLSLPGSATATEASKSQPIPTTRAALTFTFRTPSELLSEIPPTSTIKIARLSKAQTVDRFHRHLFHVFAGGFDA